MTLKRQGTSSPLKRWSPAESANGCDALRVDMVDRLCDISEVCDALELLEEWVEPQRSVAEEVDRHRLAALLRILNSTLACRVRTAKAMVMESEGS